MSEIAQLSSCSDDVEILEIYSPAVHETVVAEAMPAAAAR